MAPFFETIRSFSDVPTSDSGVDTELFLEACDGFTQLFDFMGAAIFGLVQYEYRKDTNGIRSRFEAARDVSSTLENLLRNESQESRKHGTQCLVKLTRGLLFACKGLQMLQNDRSAELRDCFKQSYDIVLKHHYTFVINGPVSLALRAAPTRIAFYTRLAQGSSIELLEELLDRWLVGLDAIIKHIRVFLEQGG